MNTELHKTPDGILTIKQFVDQVKLNILLLGQLFQLLRLHYLRLQINISILIQSLFNQELKLVCKLRQITQEDWC